MLSTWIVLCVLLLTYSAGAENARAQGNVGIGTISPDASALLDLTSLSRGILIPRMTQTQRNTIASPATGLLVYCTDSLSASSPNTFYYFDGVVWRPFLQSAWLLQGNGGTTAGTNFLGTTDGQDMVFKTNSAEGMRLTTGLNLGIGTSTPTSRLHTVASGAMTTDYTGNLLTNTATSSTASITKYGAEALSTGTWNGASSKNVGLHVNATGGTTNYSATFEGGNVGVNTTAPATYVDIAGDLATRYASVTASNGANNDIAIGTSSFVRITGPTAAFSISGIAGGVDGKLLTLANSTAQPITISNESASSSASDRIWTLSNLGDIVINGQGAADLIYSAADSRWIVITSSTTVSTSTTGTITRKKPDDESVVNSTTLQNDDDLVIPIPANDSMQIEGYIDMKSVSGGTDGKIAFTIPAGATMNIMSFSTKVNSIDEYFLKSSGTASGAIDFNTNSIFENGILLFGTVVTGSTAGNIQLQWAQFAAKTVVLTFKAGSYLEATYIRN